jgi:hypothetical protein
MNRNTEAKKRNGLVVKKRNGLVGIAVALAVSLALPGAASAAAAGPDASLAAGSTCQGNPTLGSGDVGYQIRCLINKIRTRYHRRLFSDSRPLNAAAHEYADNLARGDSSATPASLAKANHYCSGGNFLLYNLVYVGSVNGSKSGAERAVDFWWSKPALRKVILKTNLRDIGRRGVTARSSPKRGTYVMLLGRCT